MLYLRAYLPADRVHEIAEILSTIDTVRHVVRAGASDDGLVALVTADVEPRSARGYRRDSVRIWQRFVQVHRLERQSADGRVGTLSPS